MEGKRIHILNMEDERVDHMALMRMVEKKVLPYDIDQAETLADAYELIRKKRYDIVLIDYRIPDGTGLDLLEKIRGTPSVLITGSGDERVAVEAMKGGAYDYIIKDPTGGYLECLPATIDKVLKTFHMEEKCKRADEKIRMLSRAVEQSPSTVMITDAKGNIEYVNPKFVQLTGYTYKELIGQNLRTLKSGKTPSEEYERLWNIITSGNEWRGEICNKKKNGELYWESASISSIKNQEGVITHFIAVYEDITERKKIEEELKISYKMASIGRLTAGVFHEILNPVNIISSHVQLLLMEAEKDSKNEKDLKSIQEEIDRIVNITDGLLRFSRKDKHVVDEVEANGLLEKTVSIVEPEMKLKSIKFIRDFEKGLPKIMANSGELRQVFLNLITNARDAMPEGGALTISTRSVKKIEKLFVRIKFIDTGTGIKAEDIDKIFEPFFTTKDEVVGTGLGLSTSYSIIRNHEGTLSVDSEEGKGSTFIIDLPAKT